MKHCIRLLGLGLIAVLAVGFRAETAAIEIHPCINWGSCILCEASNSPCIVLICPTDDGIGAGIIC